MTHKIKVIIPAYNEENSIAKVINDIPSSVDEVIVISNNSTTISIEAESDFPGTIIGKIIDMSILDISFDLKSSSLVFILLTFPLNVFISPL